MNMVCFPILRWVIDTIHRQEPASWQTHGIRSDKPPIFPVTLKKKIWLNIWLIKHKADKTIQLLLSQKQIVTQFCRKFSLSYHHPSCASIISWSTHKLFKNILSSRQRCCLSNLQVCVNYILKHTLSRSLLSNLMWFYPTNTNLCVNPLQGRFIKSSC